MKSRREAALTRSESVTTGNGLYLDRLSDDDVVYLPVRVGDLRRRQAEATGPEFGSTGQCAKAVGRTARWWRAECDAGRVPGAWQECTGGPWTIPIAEARAHLARESAEKAPRKMEIRPRGPWKKAS